MTQPDRAGDPDRAPYPAGSLRARDLLWAAVGTRRLVGAGPYPPDQVLERLTFVYPVASWWQWTGRWRVTGTPATAEHAWVQISYRTRYTEQAAELELWRDPDEDTTTMSGTLGPSPLGVITTGFIIVLAMLMVASAVASGEPAQLALAAAALGAASLMLYLAARGARGLAEDTVVALGGPVEVVGRRDPRWVRPATRQRPSRAHDR